MSNPGVTLVKDMLSPMTNSVQFLCEEGPCANFLSVCVISCARSVRSPSVTGRRMGGNNVSTLDRICAQCQGKVAHFEIVRIIHFNFYKKTTSTHTYSFYFIPSTHQVHIIYLEPCSVVQLHATVTCSCATLCSLQLKSVFLLKIKCNCSATLYTKCKCTTHFAVEMCISY